MKGHTASMPATTTAPVSARPLNQQGPEQALLSLSHQTGSRRRTANDGNAPLGHEVCAPFIADEHVVRLNEVRVVDREVGVGERRAFEVGLVLREGARVEVSGKTASSPGCRHPPSTLCETS